MTKILFWWAMCAGLLIIATSVTVLAASGVAEANERPDREWQEVHWARETAVIAHPDTCPPDVLEWLSKPLVLADRLDALPLLSFQRCAMTRGHDRARAQTKFLDCFHASPM